MRPIDRIVRGLVGVTGVAQLLLGVTFWTGHAFGFVPLHMGVGIAFVAALWVLALRAAWSGAGRPIAIATIIWGGLVLAFGMTQAQILPGPYHWIVKSLHLAVGIVAMGLAARLERAMKEAKVGAAPERAVARVA